MQQKIIILLLFLLVLLLACVKKEDVVSVLATPDYKNTTKQANINDQQKYHNNDYSFEIKYPKNWHLYDCSDSYFSVDGQSLMVFLSSNENINCGTRWQQRRVDITISKKEELFRYAKNETYEEKEISVNDLSVKQHLVNHEILDDEGRRMKIRPIMRRIITFIPFEDKFIILSYNEIYQFLGDLSNKPEDLIPQENFESIYDEIVDSFKFD